MKKLLVWIFVVLMFAGLAAAPPMPAPVDGFVSFNGVPADRISVVVTNRASGEVLTSTQIVGLKTDKGKFLFDLGDFKQGYIVKDRRGSGDTVEIKVCEVLPECIYSYEILDTSVKTVRLEILSTLLPPPPVLEPVTQYVCSDGFVVASADACPAVPPVVTPVYKCGDGTEVQDLSECPLTKTNVVQILTSAGIGGALIGVAALIAYYWKKGQKVRAKKMLNAVLKKKRG